MIKTISADKLEFLRKEVILWEEANILNREQGRLLVDQYQLANHRSSLISILSIAGAALLGLAMCASVAANTTTTGDKWLLFGVAVIMFIGTFIFAWLRIDKPNGRTLAEAMLVLSCTMYGSAIATITQLFHFSSSTNWEGLVFAVGCAGLAVITRSPVVLFITNTAVLIWTGSSTTVDPTARVIPCIIALSLSYYFRNRWALALALISFGMLLVDPLNNLYGGPMYGCTLLAWHARHSRSDTLKHMAIPYLVLGLMAICLSGIANSHPFCTTKLSLWSVALMGSLAACSTFVRRFRQLGTGFAAALIACMLGVFSQIASTPPPSMFYAQMSDSSVLLISYSVVLFSFIYCAHMSQDRWLLSIPLLAVTVVAFGHMIEGQYAAAAVWFVVVGAVALLAALLLRREQLSLVTAQDISR